MPDTEVRLGLEPKWTGPLAAATVAATAFAAVKRRHTRSALKVAATLAVLSVGAWYDFEIIFERIDMKKK